MEKLHLYGNLIDANGELYNTSSCQFSQVVIYTQIVSCTLAYAFLSLYSFCFRMLFLSHNDTFIQIYGFLLNILAVDDIGPAKQQQVELQSTTVWSKLTTSQHEITAI